MHRVSLPDYWEALENHNWFYAWADSVEEYNELLKKNTQLAHMARLSFDHAQLYCAYVRCMYDQLTLDEERNVEQAEIPPHRKPTAA